MANLTSALQELREERKQAQYQVDKLESAISVLEDLVGRNGSLTRTAVGGSRVVTTTARWRMAAAQRARWAKVRQQAQTPQTNKPRTTPSPKRTLSAAGRRKIAAAQRARWARVKVQQTKKAA
jgi:hypothetical protein